MVRWFWSGQRQASAHWKGDLPPEHAREAFQKLKIRLEAEGWDFAPERTKILMLTHKLLAAEQGYPSLPDVFRFNTAFTKKEHSYIEYFVDVLEPTCLAFQASRYGEMFDALDGDVPMMKSVVEKREWADALGKLLKV